MSPAHAAAAKNSRDAAERRFDADPPHPSTDRVRHVHLRQRAVNGKYQPVNPNLSKLQPYPFEKLRQLFAGVTPNPQLREIRLSIGEPQHATPGFIKDALSAGLSGLASYPTTLGSDELRRSIDAAQILGASLCTVAFCGWPDYLSEAEGYEYYRQLFTILINHAAERKVEVALENSIRHAHQLKYFREIFFRLPKLKLLYDIGHGNVNTVKSMTRDYLFALSDRLAHVHLSDNNGQEDLNLPFGAAASGGIDLERELRELRNFQYNGTITLQMYGDRRWLLACAQIVREAWGRG